MVHKTIEESDEEEDYEAQGRTFNSPNEPRTPEVEEERTAQPSTPKPPEDGRISSQKIFEDIHEQLVYDTIEEKLSNLIDIEPEGKTETREVSITLEKSMTFKFKVHSGTPDLAWAVKDVLNELKDHFEKTLKYNVETTLEDLEKFPTHMRAVKKTRVTVNKEVGKEYDKVNIEKYDETRKVKEWDTLMCLAMRTRNQR